MLSDPASQISEWIEWPAADRDQGKPLDYDHNLMAWVNRDRYLTCRPVPGDALTLSSLTVGAEGVWTDQSPGSRFYFPPWATRLVLGVNLQATITTDPEASNILKVRARFGTGGGYAYSGEPGVYSACVVRTRLTGFPPAEETYCAGPAPDADQDNDAGVNWYVKRMLFDIPATMRGTEQPFIYQISRSFDVSGGKLSNDGVLRPAIGWYLIQRPEGT